MAKPYGPFDVLVVGLGHVGCEAAPACARMGLSEEPLEGADSPLAVGGGGRRIQGERQLVCHMKKVGPMSAAHAQTCFSAAWK